MLLLSCPTVLSLPPTPSLPFTTRRQWMLLPKANVLIWKKINGQRVIQDTLPIFSTKSHSPKKSHKRVHKRGLQSKWQLDHNFSFHSSPEQPEVMKITLNSYHPETDLNLQSPQWSKARAELPRSFSTGLERWAPQPIQCRIRSRLRATIFSPWLLGRGS